MGMANFLQFQDKPAKVVWWPGPQSEPDGIAAAGSSSRLNDVWPSSAPGAASLASALIALKRFLAQRDDARSWLPTFGNGLIADPSHRESQLSNGAVQSTNDAQTGTCGPHDRSSVWGCWL